MTSYFAVDGMVSAEEYVTGWVMATNETVKRSTIFFGILDANMDGMLDVTEITNVFNGMDNYPSKLTMCYFPNRSYTAFCEKYRLNLGLIMMCHLCIFVTKAGKNNF